MIEPWPAEATVLSERVAVNVRVLRRARGWSVQQLADKLTAAGTPVQRQALTKLENGRRRKVSVDELYAFARVFGVSEHLLTFADNPIGSLLSRSAAQAR